MNPRTCPYVFTNTTKNHTKGEVCNLYIRSKTNKYCWNHKNCETETENKTIQDEPKKETPFIQLENSVPK